MSKGELGLIVLAGDAGDHEVNFGVAVDLLEIEFASGALALASRRPALAGLLIGAAVGRKITFGLFALAILWGLRERPLPELVRHVGVMTLAGLAVLVPAHLWTGAHTYDRLEAAGSQVSLATPWRLVTNELDPVFGSVVRDVVGLTALGLGAVLAVLLLRQVRRRPTGLAADEGETASMARAAVALTVGWLLLTPYSLPWYDSMVWAPLALLAPSLLDGALLARLFVLVLADVPGRVVGMSAQVEDITLGFRKSVAPWLELAVIVLVVAWTCLRPKHFRFAQVAAGPVAPMVDDEEQRGSSAALTNDSTSAQPTE